LFEEMVAEGRKVLAKTEIPVNQIEFHMKADMRYVGQKHEITVPIGAPEGNVFSAETLLDCFQTEYRRIFGRIYPDIPIEALTWRLVTSGPPPSLGSLGEAEGEPNLREQPLAWRDVAESGGAHMGKWPVYHWSQLPVAKKFSGPALIEDAYTTVVVSSFFDFEKDEASSIHLRRKEPQ
jgi:N-methylhydantoinase A